MFRKIYIILESVRMKRTTNADRPFLRWAGGKTWLTDFVLSLTKDLEINHYYEPFLGGGAVFFALKPENAILSDVNSELIHTYTTLREKPEEVISVLKTFQNESECYYRVRADVRDDDVYMCARFIFLNQTSYNGLYRVNMAGQYNVPFGRRKIDFIKEEDVLKVSLDGRLDTTTAPDFEEFVNANYQGAKAMEIDCEKLSYVSSAGLRVLLTAHKRMKGAMKLTGVGELVMEVFEMTGFADILVIE